MVEFILLLRTDTLSTTSTCVGDTDPRFLHSADTDTLVIFKICNDENKIFKITNLGDLAHL